MFKLGLIGAQSYHAEQFSKLINTLGVIDAKITHIWGEPGQEERVQQLKDAHEISTVCTNYTDMIGQIDAALLITRNGADHFMQAKPFMDAHIPIWIDKPIALDSKDVEQLCAYAQASGTPLMGGSTLKHSSDMRNLANLVADFKQIDYFSFSFCSSVDAPTGGVSFYGFHVAEIVYFLFGGEIDTVIANRHGKTITVLLNYKNGMTANLIMTEGGFENTYSVVGGGQYAAAHITCHDCYEQEMRYLYDVLTQKDKPLFPEQFIMPARIMETIERALEHEGLHQVY